MNLRAIRKSRGLTMKQLGEMVGVSESAIGQYETHNRKPSFEILLKLGEALDCSVDEIVNERKKPATEGDGPRLNANQAEAMNIISQLTDSEVSIALSTLKGIMQARQSQGDPGQS